MKRIVLEVERSPELVLKTDELRKCIKKSGLQQKELIDKLPQEWTPAVLHQYIEKERLWHYISQHRLVELAKALGVDLIHIKDKPIKLKL